MWFWIYLRRWPALCLPHEWTQEDEVARAEAGIIRDANGNQLENGDSVTVIKDLKLNATTTIKQGTKAKNIRLIDEPVDGHDIACRLMALVAFISNQFTSRNNQRLRTRSYVKNGFFAD